MPHVKGNKFKPKQQELVDDEVDNPAVKFEEAEIIDDDDDDDAPPPPTKKIKREKPVIPTVVRPVPKGNDQVGNKAVATSNWESLKVAIQERAKKSGTKKSKLPTETPAQTTTTEVVNLTRVLAIDCEMVGAGKRGDLSMLARVSIVNAAGAVVLDSYVAPTSKVTDYRTKWSGVRAFNLKDAPAFEGVKSSVVKMLKGRVVIGHAVHNDLQVLGIEHPEVDLRDTSRYPPLMKTLPGGRMKPRALRHLAQEHLAMAIQSSEHCPIEDARAALGLYQKHRKEWEKWLVGVCVMPRVGGGGGGSSMKMMMMNNGSSSVLGSEELAKLAQSDYMADL